MADFTVKLWGQKQRPWGWEVRVDLTDAQGGIRNEVLTFPMKDVKDIPDTPAIAKGVDNLLSRIEAQRLSEEVEAVQKPIREAQETKEAFMGKVASGLIKAEDSILALQPYVKVAAVGVK